MNAHEPFVLGEWTVDPATGTLTGPAGQRRLTPKLTDLLVALAQRAGHVASRDELLRVVWGERSAVSDEPLTRAVADLRKILGDVRADPTYIETIPKRGYRVVAAVRAAPAAASERDVAAPRPEPATGAAPDGAAAAPLHPWAGAVPLAPGQWAGTCRPNLRLPRPQGVVRGLRCSRSPSPWQPRSVSPLALRAPKPAGPAS